MIYTCSLRVYNNNNNNNNNNRQDNTTAATTAIHAHLYLHSSYLDRECVFDNSSLYIITCSNSICNCLFFTSFSFAHQHLLLQTPRCVLFLHFFKCYTHLNYHMQKLLCASLNGFIWFTNLQSKQIKLKKKKGALYIFFAW